MVVVEDLRTTGCGSMVKTIDLVESAEPSIKWAFCLVDHKRGTEKDFSDIECSVFSIFRISELL